MTFEEMKSNILQCRDCAEKFGFDPIPIVHGNENSKILQISQAPSSNVHLTQKPFNDSTGKKLKYQWYKITDDIFYDENNFYITALSHCFPGKNSSGGDRLPPKLCAKKWLKEEIELINNEIFIVIGSQATKFLFPNDDYNSLVFKDNYINEKLAIVLPHPSPLNIKWFKDHPKFEESRLPIIRKKIWSVLGVNEKRFKKN